MGVERPAWMVRLATHLNAAIDRDPGLRDMIAADWDLDWTAVPLSAADIFFDLLNKPANTGALQVKEITIEGSFSCSNLHSARLFKPLPK